ncbi:MAG: hypothetical protein XD49_1930 [Caldanaerobacter subterraneus]|jgi:predicted transcriptional regulator|uniref:Uncharacterized protein n=2 Tax=Caldanaerobacter subterraneus TaxID=911092 RepID=A0A101E2N7_9THEO|nr:hypothetical protein [Caldanaerobacter subterraneus]KKC29379.1 hypothetical protein CDSM653_01602 [Caldanaerobacter subterraneus subsp. pacificus DSM 12653]KUK08030.1 MAG: hypothetical protein XD49_1930 [Caldanaerobacter subterraneus]TCO61801.1 hypothetical protein EV203_11867 [Caldanaerobacter subterraneus]
MELSTEEINKLIFGDTETYRKILEGGEKAGRLAVARELLEEGMEIDKIAKITKLSIEEIDTLILELIGELYFKEVVTQEKIEENIKDILNLMASKMSFITEEMLNQPYILPPIIEQFTSG